MRQNATTTKMRESVQNVPQIDDFWKFSSVSMILRIPAFGSSGSQFLIISLPVPNGPDILSYFIWFPLALSHRYLLLSFAKWIKLKWKFRQWKVEHEQGDRGVETAIKTNWVESVPSWFKLSLLA